VVKVVSLAMARDGASGGVVRTVTCKFLKVSESWINNRYLLVSPRTRNRYLQVSESFSKDVFNLD